MRLNIAFDIDGVCVDLMTQILSHLEQATKKNVRENPPTQFDLHKHYGNIPHQIIDEAVFLCFDSYRKTPIMPGARNFLARIWKETGCPIQFVTARPIAFAVETHRLIMRFYTGLYQIAFAETCTEKIRYLENYLCFVEDRRNTAIKLANAGKKIFMPKATWNNLEYNHPNITVIKNLNDLYNTTTEQLVDAGVYLSAGLGES